MMRRWLAANRGWLSMLFWLCLCARPAFAQDSQQNAAPTYTIGEYNAFQAARAETNAQARIKLLDDFVTKFPKSALLPYVYDLYYRTYGEQKNYPETIVYVDKLLALGDKIDQGAQLDAYIARAQAFYLGANQKPLTTPEALSAARDAARKGLQALAQWKKPDKVTDEQYAQQKKSLTVLFNSIAGIASSQLRDYQAAAHSFQGVLAVDPKDAVTYYRLGIALLQETPSASMDGFWALARAISLKAPGEAQVRDYLRKRLLAYQQPGCDNLIDAQMKELIQLATNSAERPASYGIPSAADLDRVRQQSTILTVLNDLKAGGDKAMLTWLTVCGSDFPEVVGKVIEVVKGDDAVTLRVYTGATSEEMEAATSPNMDVKVVGQPEAARLQKDDGVRFSGALVSYDPEPFMLHWDKCKVNPEDIPPEKPEVGKHRPHRVPRKPGR